MIDDYEQPTLWSGCLGPVVRNFLITGMNFIISVVIGAMMNSWWWFLGCMVVLTIIYDLVSRRLWRRRDDVLRRRFWGLDG